MELVRAARVVVTHAGVGTIMVALANGKRPVVMPRLSRFAEAVDDHQLGLARRLSEADFVTLVEDEAGLANALRALAPACDRSARATAHSRPSCVTSSRSV